MLKAAALRGVAALYSGLLRCRGFLAGVGGLAVLEPADNRVVAEGCTGVGGEGSVGEEPADRSPADGWHDAD